MADIQPASTVAAHPPATFGLRTLAKLADLLVVNVVSGILFCAYAILQAFGLPAVGLIPWLVVPFVLFCVLYFALGTSGSRQTIGYRLAGLRAVLAREEIVHVGMGRALARSVLSWLAWTGTWWGLVGIVDYLPVAMTPAKRALHDLATGTRVISAGRPHYAALGVYAVLLVIFPLVMVFGVIRPSMIQAYYMPSPGMAPTLGVNTRFLVNKLCYQVQAPQRGDIVVFFPPNSAAPYLSSGPDVEFTKRIVGLPGEDLRMAGGRVLIYREGALSEPYIRTGYVRDLPQPAGGDEDDWFESRRSSLVEHDNSWWIRVPAGQYFVLGDNRNDSNDSHVWGFVPRGRIVGKVTLVFSPQVRDL